MDLIDLRKPRFKQRDVLDLVQGLSAKTLQNWNQRSIFEIVDQFPGRHAKRLYAPIDVIMLTIMVNAAQLGIAAGAAQKIAEQIAPRVEALYSAPSCVVGSGRPEWSISLSDLKNYQRAIIFKRDGEHIAFILNDDDYNRQRPWPGFPNTYVMLECDFIILQCFNRMYAKIAGVDLTPIQESQASTEASSPDGHDFKGTQDQVSASGEEGPK